MSKPILITTYRDSFKEQIGVLITSIQKEFGVPITYEEQPDLQNIPGVYQKDAGNFWVALEQDRVIGTIALIDRGQHTGVLRKMFVQRDYRGAASGVAKRLLDTLLDWAKSHGIREIYLGTGDLLPAAKRFYEKHGFHPIADEDMPPHVAAIRMAVDNRHYHMELAA